MNVANSYGETPVFLAGVSCDIIAVETLISLGADVNAKCCVLEETILHQACLSNKNLLMERLLNVPGINVSAQNRNGWTPLHLAAQNGDVYKVQRLLEAGADVTVQSTRGDTPIFFSVHKKACQGDRCAFSVLFNHVLKIMGLDGAEKHLLHIDKKRESLLDCAIKHENFVALKTLLEFNGIFNIHDRDSEGRSLLHLSIIHAPNRDIISYLLEKGLSPNELDSKGNTPLIYFFKQKRIVPHMPVMTAAVTPNLNV